MKKYISILVIIAATLFSCSKEMSLQKYFVTKSAEEGFMSVNVPSSMLQLKEGQDNEENMEALKSFRRLNVLIYKKDENTTVNQEKEVATIERILSAGDFKELMSMNYKGHSGVLSYTGDDNQIKEVIGFGEGEEGFILLRLTGDKMTVKQLAKLASAIDFDKSNLEDLKNLDL
ncbi:MAG: DUF4252 domain-containing protein [Bacteroidota bacterium]